MTNNDKATFKGAKLVDFTGSVKGFRQMNGFGQDFIDMVRKDDDGAKSVVVVDRGFGGRYAQPAIVRDHLNLSGNNPLVGPNHPLGERFTIVQGIYADGGLKGFESGIAAGLKEGVHPQGEDISLLRRFGADFYCYNIVPSMLIAAHAHWRVLGIVLPDGVELNVDQLSQLSTLTGDA